jgi:hypothetical protein
MRAGMGPLISYTTLPKKVAIRSQVSEIESVKQAVPIFKGIKKQEILTFDTLVEATQQKIGSSLNGLSYQSDTHNKPGSFSARRYQNMRKLSSELNTLVAIHEIDR